MVKQLFTAGVGHFTLLLFSLHFVASQRLFLPTVRTFLLVRGKVRRFRAYYEN